MKTRILVAALACLSIAAVAQQSNSEQKPSPKAGQATNAREAASGKATGKTMAQDDWHQPSAASSSAPQLKKVSNEGTGTDDATMVRESPSKASLGRRESPTKPSAQVSVGDLNGDGAPDKAATSPSHGTAQSPRDAASGQASGKRQHNPITVTKEVDKASPKQ